MAVVRKYPAPKFVCGTFKWRYENWYEKEFEARQQKVIVEPRDLPLPKRPTPPPNCS